MDVAAVRSFRQACICTLAPHIPNLGLQPLDTATDSKSAVHNDMSANRTNKDVPTEGVSNINILIIGLQVHNNMLAVAATTTCPQIEPTKTYPQ